MKFELEQYRREMEQELEHILGYWMKYTVDHENGGFIGKIDHSNTLFQDAPKGSVLNSRILWGFSAAYQLTNKKEYLSIAEKSFFYLAENFIDKRFGGVYWTVDFKGRPLDTKKQTYALAFAVYGLSEFYICSANETAKKAAINLYRDIVEHSYDEKNGGYIEALSVDWKEIADLRLSAKDANEKKSMNTHLHLLEAFSNLFKIWPDAGLKEKITELIQIFLDHIISKESNHLILFFDDEWNVKSTINSYGHDIEAAWLLQEAAETVRKDSLLMKVKESSVQLARAAVKGLDTDGGMWYEYDPANHHLISEKHSWPQAEAMVGFFNAFQITGDEEYFKRSVRSWEFVQQYIHDKNSGEWYWGVYEDHAPMLREDKVGIWKCPYHNSRACIEIIKRINLLTDKNNYETQA